MKKKNSVPVSPPVKKKSFLSSVLRRVLSFAATVAAAILICFFIVTLSTSKTILNEQFMKTQLRKADAYDGVSEAVKDSFRDIYEDSSYKNEAFDGYLDKFVNTVFKPKLLQKQIEPIIHELYEGNVPKITGEYFTAAYSDAIREYMENQSSETEKRTVSTLISDVGRAIRQNVDLKAVGRIVQKWSTVLHLPLTLVWILCFIGAILLIVIVSIVVKAWLRMIRTTCLISGVLMLLVAILCWIYVPKDLIIINLPITAFVRRVVTWLIVTFFLYGLKNVLLAILITLFIRKRKKKALLKAAAA